MSASGILNISFCFIFNSGWDFVVDATLVSEWRKFVYAITRWGESDKRLSDLLNWNFIDPESFHILLPNMSRAENPNQLSKLCEKA